jgi:hypothetical protein
MEVLQRTANRGSISDGGYEVANSLKLEPDNGERFDTGDKFTNYSSVRKFTVSGWFKRTELSVQSVIWFNVNTGTSVTLQFEAGDYLSILFQDNVGNGVESYAKTSALFRDTSAWYHVVLAVDTTDGTAADRTKIYVNGVNQTLAQGNASYDTFPAQNYDVPLQTRHYLLGYDGSDNGFRGYAAEYYFLDGITASPTDFGEYDEDSGIWKPIEYTGGFGNEGYYLDFEDASALGKDVSSNNQGNFVHYGGSAADQATDTPTNNFATWNVLDVTRTNTQGVDMVEGAMSIKHRSSNGWTGTCSTMAVSNGKWYWEGEVRVTNGGSMWGVYPVATRQANVFFDTYIGAAEGGGYDSGAAFYDNDDGYYHDNTFTACTISGSTFNTQAGDVVMIAVDMDNNKLYAGVNGNWCNSSNNTLPNATGITLSDEPHFLAAATYDANTTNSYNLGGFTTDTISSAETDANGYGTFEYAPPSGYYALCTKNLAEFG